MTKKQWQYLLLLPALLLALSGCGSADSTDDDTTDDSDDSSVSCTTSTETILTVAEVTLTEVDEAAGDNSTLALAQSISINSRVSGSLDKPSAFSSCEGYGGSADCDDHYVLSVSEGDEVSIVLKKATSTGGIDFDLVVYNDTTYLDQSVDGVETETLDLTIPAGMDTLRIAVQDPVSGTGTYELIVKTPVEPVEVAAPPSEECQSNFNGVITSALTGGKIEGVTVNLRQGEDNKTSAVNETTTTNASGEFAFENILSQDYTVELQLTDYITSYYNVELPGQKTIEKTYSLTPNFTGDYRIVLNWGALPEDLDSVMKGPKADGSGTFKVGYWNKSDQGTTLDRDDVSSFGPETTTIVTRNATQDAGEYNFYVICRGSSGSGCPGSDATVTIFNQEGVFKQVEMTSEGSGYYWNVFTITGDTFNEINEISDSAP